jgi:hypothetical protein
MVGRKARSQKGGKIRVYRSRVAIPVFSGQLLQRGHGFGGLFRGLLKTIAPMAKRGLLSVGKAALNAGARALEDVRDNDTTVKEALKKQAVQTFHPRNVINRTLKKRKATSSPAPTQVKVAKRVKRGRGGAVKKKTIADAPRLSR